MAGGLERNFVLLANHFAQQGKNVHLITFDFPGASAHYKLSPKIKWHQIAQTPPHSAISFWQRYFLIIRIRKILKALRKPILICFHHGILARVVAATLGLNSPIICSERNSLELYSHITQTNKWSLGFALLIISSYITVQFPRYIKDYPWWLKNRIRVIPNPVFPAKAHALPTRPSTTGRFILIQLGRLCDQKNQILLIDAFASICKKHYQWDLHIVGDGNLKEDIISHIKHLALRDRVFLMGNRNDVPELLTSSHLFCIPSKWEGFPNALAEAMAHGLPAIGLSDCPGVRDLIIDNETGKLTSKKGLSQALDHLMSNPKTRQAMGGKARTYIAQYTPDKSFQCWNSLLEELKSNE